MKTNWVIAIFLLIILIPAAILLAMHIRKSGNGGNGGGGGGGNGGGGGGNGGHGNYAAKTAIEGAVNRQNCYRKKAGLGELKIDPALQKRAQAWVDYLKDSDSCKMRHPGTTGNQSECRQYLNGECGVSGDGQNIARQESSQQVDLQGPSAFNWAVDGWYDECQEYRDHGWNSKPGNETGHYTQLMWKDATRIGCGAANCGPNVVLVNCNYGADNGSAGNLNPPSDGGKFSTSMVPIACGIDCDLRQSGQAALSPIHGKVRTGKSLVKK